MIKNFLCGWIIFQLIVIGLVGATAHNQIMDKTFDCNPEAGRAGIFFASVVLPLAWFLPVNQEVQEYCKAKSPEAK